METYQNYFQNHSYWIRLEQNSEEQNKRMDKRFWSYIKADSKVLELGTWLWGFANYCVYKQVKNYVWIEVDKTVADELSKQFPDYTILCVDALEYFDQTDEKYDVIYLSHVFEHFSIEEGIRLARQIAHHLTPQGVWINFMPNAWSISGALGRYNDITHKTIYTSNSFNQVLQEAGIPKENIHHFNVQPRGFIKTLISRLLWKLIAIDYYTFELMSVIWSKQ